MHELVELAAELRERAPTLLERSAGPLLDDLRRRFVADVIRVLTNGSGAEHCYAEDAARELVEGGVTPEEAVLAFRECAHAAWDLARDLARRRDPDTYQALLEQAGDIWIEYEHWTSAMTDAYRDAARQRDQRAAQEREACVTALLTGAGGNTVELRHSADALALPKSGQFCVVVVEGDRGQADPEQALRAQGVPSVWSMTLLEQIGIVSLGTIDRTGLVREVMAQCATGRVGVSSVYNQLGHTPLAARLAHVALASLPPGTHNVSTYGDRPLETLVASAPETARDMAESVLGGLLKLPTEDQQTLLDTIEVWCDAGGNINRTAELLYCHRNTVRHRLDRIEALTGRAMSEPRGITETLIAVQAYRLHIVPG